MGWFDYKDDEHLNLFYECPVCGTVYSTQEEANRCKDKHLA